MGPVTVDATTGVGSGPGSTWSEATAEWLGRSASRDVARRDGRDGAGVSSTGAEGPGAVLWI
jgi:hypothetical protein